MPTITASLRDLEGLAGIPCPPDALAKQLELVKGEVKSHDVATGELRIELNDTNRPDLWSVEGIARQLRDHHRSASEKYPFFCGTKSGGTIIAEGSVAAVRPFVGGFVAYGLTITGTLLRSLIESQEKLAEHLGRRRRSLAIGIYSASKIAFPITYTAAEPTATRFVPLGMDTELDLAEIIERHPKGIAYGPILADVDRFPVLVDASGTILSFPPVINSRNVGEVREGDRTLLVEATGTDIFIVLLGLNILAVNLSDRGATITPCATRYSSASATPLGQREIVAPYPLERSVTLERGACERLLGIDPPAEDIASGLRAYGCRVDHAANGLKITAPPYRLDYLHPVDAIEDYAISAGYDTLEPQMPTGFTVGTPDPLSHLEGRVRDHLIGYAFEEIMTNVLTGRAAESERVGRSPEGLVEVANVMLEGYAVLRRSLLPSLLRVEAASATSQYPHRLFEVGECAVTDPTHPDGSLTVSLAGALLAHSSASFSELHSYLDRLCYDLGLEYRLAPQTGMPLIDGRHAEILVGETVIGYIGEIHPKILTLWGLRTPLVAFEVELTRVLEIVGAHP